MKKFISGIIIGILFVVILAAGALFAAYRHEKSAYEATANLSAPIEIPDAGIVEYNQISDVEKPSVVLFYADWCTYCRRFMPEYGKVAKKYGDKYMFSVVNCDKAEYEDLVRKFHIIGFPSLFISDKKLEHDFSLNPASTADLSVFKAELDDYLKFRGKMINNLNLIDKQFSR